MAEQKPAALIEVGSQQLKEAKIPTNLIETEGSKRLVRTREYFEVLTKAWKDDALTWEEVKGFLDQSERQLGVLENIPKELSFSMKRDSKGAAARRKVLDETLARLGVAPIQIGKETLTPSEIWDAVYYQASDEKTQRDYPYLKDARGKKVVDASEKIVGKIDKQQQRVIIAFEDGLLAEDIDPRSLTSEKILARDGVNSVRLNEKQKIGEKEEIQVRDTLVLRAKLDRYDVVTAFLNQRAEGRGGQGKPPELGDSQLPGMISYKEGEKTLRIQGLSDGEVLDVMAILEDVDLFKERHKEELLGGFQGRVGWIAEASLRRMHEVWKETSDIFQKNTSSLLTWTSELGHGCMVSEWLSIPAVAEILTWPELYQQREAVTDRPLPIKDLASIEAQLKRRAKDLDLPSSKVDLAIFLSQILQLGYWTGRAGWKTRHPAEKYAFLDIAAGLPVWSWEVFVDKNSNLTPEEKKVFTPEKRKIFDFQLAQLNAFIVGMSMTGYTVEHLGRIPDEASQEDLLYLTEVGEAPVYNLPDDALIKVIADLDATPFELMKKNFQTSFLHREQYRWQFVYAYYSGLLKEKAPKEYEGIVGKSAEKAGGIIGEEAVEKRYFNPDSAENRKVLISYLTTNTYAKSVMNEAGLDTDNLSWLTDDVIKAVSTDENMRAVNDIRQAFFKERNREIALTDLVPYSLSSLQTSDERIRNQRLAAILEFVLRDKRTWNLDMGKSNSRFNSQELPVEIRQKGGFSADQIGVMVTAEYLRKSHVETLSQFLEVMARAHLRNEFYTGKDIVEKLSTKYGDLPRVRASSLVNPWTILETAVSIRAAMMLIAYWDAGYAHTGGRMVIDQETLYDQLDIDRIFHERFFPVIGAAQRVRMGREEYIKEEKKTCLRQRAKISMAEARFFERQFYAKMAPLEGIIEIKTGEGGKHIYTHGVPVYRNGRYDVVYPEDQDYYMEKVKRYAEMFYLPASKFKLEQMNSQAKQKQLDEDHARQQIDQIVSLGFMRCWRNDKGIDVGLGNLFKVQFDNKEGQTLVYPIEFMNSLAENVRAVAVDYATAQGFQIDGYPPEISARYFWETAKYHSERLNKNGQKIWNDFCSMMIEGWLVDPSLPDSMLPQFYWEWKDMAQEALGIPEGGMRGIGGALRLGFREVKDVVVGQALKLLNIKGSIWEKTLRKPGLQANMIGRWQADPIPRALEEIKKNFSDKIVFDFVEQMRNAEKEGTFLRDKLGYRQQIRNAFLAGQINEQAYDALNSLVASSSYRPNFFKNWNNPNYQIHRKWATVHGWLVETLVTWGAKMAEKDLTNNLTAQWIFTYLNADPIGYEIAIAGSIGVGIVGSIGAAIAGTFAMPSLLAIGTTFLGFQGAASGISAIFRIIDYFSRKASKGRSSVFGTTADGLIFEQEYTGQK